MNTSVPATLPAEILAEIALVSVIDDTVDRTWSALPLVKNVAWKKLEALPARNPGACVRLRRDCLSSGFIERATACSLSEDPVHAEESTGILAPGGLFHTAFICTQVCRSWRQAVRGHPALWAKAGLLNLTFINRSRALAGGFRPQLVNLRPVCPCFLGHALPLLSYAQKIVFSTDAFTSYEFLVTESVLRELEAAVLVPGGSVLTRLDLQLTKYAVMFLPVNFPFDLVSSPGHSTTLISKDSIRIDSLITARLTNTHFTCHGLRLKRLELTLEDRVWRLRTSQILEVLVECPALEHLSLVTSCTTLSDAALDQAWDPDTTNVVELPHLSCFILEDVTRQCLELLSSIVVPPDCDFHWLVIEPFGQLHYGSGDLDVHLHFLMTVFAEKIAAGPAMSIAVLEVIPDFGGSNIGRKRTVREWPEEMRVTFACTTQSALSQFVLRPGVAGDVLYRDLTSDAKAPRRSFGVRSEMLSTKVTYRNLRHRPFFYVNPEAKKPKAIWVDVPEFESVVGVFMENIMRLTSFLDVSTVVIPRHAYIPPNANAWSNLLNGVDMTTLVLPGITQHRQLDHLAAHLATNRPHPQLTRVSFPNIKKGGVILSDTELFEYMDDLLGERRGCEEIMWYARELP